MASLLVPDTHHLLYYSVRCRSGPSGLDPEREERNQHAAVLGHGLAGGPERSDRVLHGAAVQPQVLQFRRVGLRQLLSAVKVRLGHLGKENLSGAYWCS